MAKVAIAQIKVFDSKTRNVKKIIEFINKASIGGANIVCFPEACLGDSILTLDCKEIKKVKDTCLKKSIYCILGVHIQEKQIISNSSIIINKMGEFEHIYKKQHLFPGLDMDKVSPGAGNKVIKTDFGKIAVIICWDIAFEKEIKELARKGAEIIFCPSYFLNSSKIRPAIFRSFPIVRAFENLSYFITCDAFGDEVLSESYICGPFGKIGEIIHKEGILFVELNLQEIRVARRKYDCLS